MKKFLNSKWILLILPLLAFSIGMSIFMSFQRFFFFHPWHDEVSYEKLKRDENYEEVRILSQDNKIIDGWLKHDKHHEEAPLIIFFIGNADNSSSIVRTYRDTQKFEFLDGFHVLVVDYPGYGISEGKITKDDDILKTGLEAYDWAIQQDFVDKDNIIVMGYSIGTGVATYLASQREVNGLILLAPYDEALSLYNARLNIFHGPLKLFAKFKLESKKYAKDVNVPVLIFASKDDEVIDYDFSKTLSNYFNKVEEFVTLQEVKHSYYFTRNEVWEQIQKYIHDRLSIDN